MFQMKKKFPIWLCRSVLPSAVDKENTPLGTDVLPADKTSAAAKQADNTSGRLGFSFSCEHSEGAGAVYGCLLQSLQTCLLIQFGHILYT